MEKKKTNGKRNRSAGHGFETSTAAKLREIGFPHVVTCRSESKSRDDCGVDLINKNERVNGKLPYNIQCKNTTERPHYDRLLAGMPLEADAINVIFHKYTRRAGDRFHPIGHYAILEMGDFLELIRKLELFKGPALEYAMDLARLQGDL